MRLDHLLSKEHWHVHGFDRYVSRAVGGYHLDRGGQNATELKGGTLTSSPDAVRASSVQGSSEPGNLETLAVEGVGTLLGPEGVGHLVAPLLGPPRVQRSRWIFGMSGSDTSVTERLRRPTPDRNTR